MSDDSDSPLSQFSIEDDEIVWHGPASDTDFIVLRHPLVDAHSLPSTPSDYVTSDSDLSPALERLSLHESSLDTSSTSAQSDNGPSKNQARTNRRTRARKAKHSSTSSDASSSEYHSGTSTPATSYEDASAFISRWVYSRMRHAAVQIAFSASFHLRSKGTMHSSVCYARS